MAINSASKSTAVLSVQAVKVVERTLGQSMVACFGEEAIKKNGLKDAGFVWVA